MIRLRCRTRLRIEPLEPRHLLSGLTLIAHGFGSGVGGWVSAMAEAIAARDDLDIDQPRYVVEVVDPGDNGGPLEVSTLSHTGPSPSDPAVAWPEPVILLDWSDVAGTLTGGAHRPTGEVAAAVADFLFSDGVLTGLPGAAAQLPLHLLGHSRGASLVSELARELGERGVWVDQVTTWDPHPVDGTREPWLFGYPDWGDAAMEASENVAFWDNYWRSDGEHSYDFTGEPVAGVWNVQLDENTLEDGGHGSLDGGEHSDTHLWYHGTVDPSTQPPANDSAHDVPNDWYGGPHPERDESGFRLSRLVGDARPAGGVAPALGGAGQRESLNWNEAVWPNVLGLQPAALQASYLIGEPIDVSFYYHDADTPATLSIGLDADRNPFNANHVPLQAFGLSSTGAQLAAEQRSADTTTADVGDYYLQAAIADADGHVRYAYFDQPLTFVAPPSEVVGQHVFYRGSSWGAAIATDKTALLPGRSAGFANYTSYAAGITGVAIDVRHVAIPGQIGQADLQLRVGNDNDPASWAAAPQPAAVDFASGAGANGADRITITWPDDAVRNQWLEVTLAANDTTGLATPHTFYFGNAVGETGDSPAHALVTAADVMAIRDHPRGPGNAASIDEVHDVNRDRRVDALDVLAARNGVTSPFSALQLIAPPLVAPAPPVAFGGDGESPEANRLSRDAPVPVLPRSPTPSIARKPILPAPSSHFSVEPYDEELLLALTVDLLDV